MQASRSRTQDTLNARNHIIPDPSYAFYFTRTDRVSCQQSLESTAHLLLLSIQSHVYQHNLSIYHTSITYYNQSWVANNPKQSGLTAAMVEEEQPTRAVYARSIHHQFLQCQMLLHPAVAVKASVSPKRSTRFQILANVSSPSCK